MRVLLFFSIGLLAMGCVHASRVVPTESTLRAHEKSIAKDDVRAAYRLLSPHLRSRISLEQFQRLLHENRDELSEQARELTRESEPQRPVLAEVKLENDERVSLLLEKGKWKIAGGVMDAVVLKNPRDSVRALRSALIRRSLPAIERTLSRQLRAELEATFQQFVDDTEDELDLAYEIHGNRATVRTTNGREIELVLESGEWRVLEVR